MDAANVDLEQGRTDQQGRVLFSGFRTRHEAQNRQAMRAAAFLPSLPANSPLPFGGNNALSALLLPTVPPQTRARSKGRSSRREREEAATLFGPNLANYFGSGNSNSGAVSGTGLAQTISLAAGAAPETAHLSPDPALHDPASPEARRPRLGSRGRVRGASLSGLSMMSLGAESVTSLGGVAPATAQGMMHGSTADLIDQMRTDTSTNLTLSEGVDIATLQTWIDRTGSTQSPVCTTLQSYCNLKRNTLRLAPASLDPLGAVALDANVLRSVPGAVLPQPTHSLFFEYDCAAPYASVQIFVRASRKHGSWLAYDLPDADSTADGLVLAQRGPPPHVLGWPVHVAQLRTGHGAGHTATLPLDLKYFAPPKRSDAEKKAPADAPAQAEPVTPAAVAETPGFEFQRRLELDTEDAEEDARPVLAQIPGEPVVEEEETKEQRLAREKTQRETLKVAIVVEALDDNARPLREPNLQTTYLRITSLPARKSVASRLAEAASGSTEETERSWSCQVEGQEAEIGPHRFQLQELYGLSSKPPPVRAAAPAGDDVDADEDAPGDTTASAAPAFLAAMDDSNGTECLICLSAPPTTLLLPCTHGLCLECAVQLRDSVIGIRQSERRRGRTPRRKYACPVCRRAYTSMLHLAKQNEKASLPQP